MTLRAFFAFAVAFIALGWIVGTAQGTAIGREQAEWKFASDCRNANEAVINGIAYRCETNFRSYK